jgi:hypothetical protein
MLAIKQSSALPCPQHSDPPAHECASKPDGGEPFEKDLVTVRAPETSLLSPVGWRETSQTPLFLRKTNPKPLESVSSLLLSSSVRELPLVMSQRVATGSFTTSNTTDLSFSDHNTDLWRNYPLRHATSLHQVEYALCACVCSCGYRNDSNVLRAWHEATLQTHHRR